jgi:hypothetical protein
VPVQVSMPEGYGGDYHDTPAPHASAALGAIFGFRSGER